MPIYEYECDGCRRRVSLLIMRPSSAPSPSCPRCGSTALRRLMSRFATVKSEEARLDALADRADLGDLDENDPASVARFMKTMGKEFGEDIGGDFDEAVDEAMAEASEEDGESREESPASSDSDTSDL